MTKLIAGILMIASAGQVNIKMDLDKIMHIESSGKPMAFNQHTQARGLFQITPIVLEEYNNLAVKKPESRHTLDELFIPEVNIKIAKWYMGKRIPQMLKHFKKPINHRNVITAWNAGINFVVRNNTPKETAEFIKKYESKD